MKNKLFGIISKLVAVVAACFMFASFSPSLDGRAVIVEDGVFPQGLFAKTVGYLPGDTICVANINGDVAVDITVIGALDPSEGVAIMLSPEAAKVLGIKRDGNNLVKITKRNGVDDRVYGSAIISNSNPDPLVKTDDFTGNEEEKPGLPMGEESQGPYIIEEEYIPDSEPEAMITEAFIEEETFETIEEAEVEEESDDTEDESFIEEDFDAEETEESAESEEFEEDFFNEEEEELPEETIAEPYEEEALPEQEDEPEGELFVPDELDDLDAAKEEVVEETPVEEEFVEEEKEAEKPEEEIFVEEEELEEETEDEEIIEESAEEEADTSELVEAEELSPVVEEIIEPEPLESITEVVETEELTEEIEENEAEEETVEDEYEAIVLVPAESNPPVSEEETVEEVVESEEEVEEVELVAESEPEAAEEVAAVVPEEPVAVVEPEAEITVEDLYGKYIVPSLKDLKKSSYYIQIAVLKDIANIEEVITTYGNNYPITIVPLSSGAAYQLMIGPLSMDEYKVVLERFKSYGYKDAFLRKIK